MVKNIQRMCKCFILSKGINASPEEETALVIALVFIEYLVFCQDFLKINLFLFFKTSDIVFYHVSLTSFKRFGSVSVVGILFLRCSYSFMTYCYMYNLFISLKHTVSYI